MVISVRTERGPDGLEVVKEADTDEGRVWLLREAAMLARAAQPGVVEVTGTGPSTLRLRHRGTSLARLGALPPDHVAAVVRSIAEVVESLHRQGIAHTRIDRDHIVIGDRGRPRLCGFAEATEATDELRAADVAALGTLLDDLLDAAGDALWSPIHRGPRHVRSRRKAMAGFRAAAKAARRDDPGQRPTARQFATAIHDALPDLALPVIPTSEPTGEFAAIPADVDPTADFAWTDDDLSFLTADDDDHEAGDPFAKLAALSDRVHPGAPDDEPSHETAAPPAWDDEADEDEAPDDTDYTVGDDTDDDGDDTADTDDTFADDTFDDDTVDDDTVDTDEVDDPDAWSAADHWPDDAGRHWSPPSVAAFEAAFDGREPDEDASADALPPIRIRPGRIEKASTAAPGTSRRTLIAIATVVLALGAVAGALIARSINPFESDDSAAATDADVTADGVSTDGAPSDTAVVLDEVEPEVPTPPPYPEACAVPSLPGPDTDGDGCPEEITLEGRLATVGNVEVDLGQEGDLAVLADHDCDGVLTPVLFRPDTGEVFVFPTWSLDEPVEVDATTVVPDGARIDAGRTACAPVTVTDRSGTEHIVAGPGA